MEGVIASRSAGIRLATVVAVLLVPVIVLGYFLTSSFREGIAIAAKEIDGVKLNSLMRPLLIGAARQDIQEADIARFADEARDYFQDSIGSGQYKYIVTTLRSPQKDYAHIEDILNQVIASQGDASGLILDPKSSTYYHAAAVVSDLPDFIHSHANLKKSGLEARSLTGATEQKRMALLLDIGKWKESFRQVEFSLVSAEAKAGDVPFELSKTRLPQLKTHFSNLDRALAESSLDQLPSYLLALPEFSNKSEQLLEDVSDVWQSSSAALKMGLEERKGDLERQLTIIGGLSVLASLFGVGSAVAMFRTTLRRLDHVEDANEELQASRAELQSMSDQLQTVNHGVIKLNRELADKMKALTLAQDEMVRRSKMAQLGQLTATVAHELRNPLGAVRTSAFVLERKLKDSDPQIINAFARISKGISRCDGIITQLLDFSRGGNIVVKSADFDAWLTDIVKAEAQKIPPQVTAHLQLGLNSAQVAFDAARLSRAVSNLISNASEALLATGEAPVKNPTIIVATALTIRGVELSISDNGPGITDEIRAKIFDPLFTTKSFGTGLGLPAVENIIRQHGGGLDVKTEAGKRTTFTMWLPVGAGDRSATQGVKGSS
jgi:signal transduction histidine kinase